MIILDPMPRVSLDFLPEEEKPHADALICNVANLELYIDRFRAALTLFDHCEKLTKPLPNPPPKILPRDDSGAWKRIACREAAMSIYHIGESISAIRSHCLPFCPSIRDHPNLDIKEVRLFEAKFAGAFPNYEQIRHSVAHVAERHEGAERVSRESLMGAHEKGGIRIIALGGARIWFGESLVYRTYSVGQKGQIMSFDMTQETLDRLIKRGNEIINYWATTLNGISKNE